MRTEEPIVVKTQLYPTARRPAPLAPLVAIGPELAQLCVVLLWASTFVVTKAAFAEVTPLAFAFVRFALMTALSFAVLAVAAHRRGTGWTVRRAAWPRFVAAGLSGYTFYQLGFLLGLDRTTPFSSSLLIAMVPLFTVVILAVGGERASSRALLGLAIAIAGVVVFLAEKADRSVVVVGDLLSLGAAVSFAAYGIVNRPLARDYPPATYTAYTVLTGSVPLLALSVPAALAQDWGAVSGRGWLAILYMTVLPVYVAYMLWNWAIARRGAAAATSFSLLVPVVSGFLAALFFAEGFGPLKLLGAALVLAGLIVLRLPGKVGAARNSRAA